MVKKQLKQVDNLKQHLPTHVKPRLQNIMSLHICFPTSILVLISYVLKTELSLLNKIYMWKSRLCFNMKRGEF